MMRIAAAQISCVLGDLEANLGKIRDFASRAKDRGAGLVVFPEMVDTGYAMPVIQARAAPWTEGAVPQLQTIARTFSIAIICGVSERDGAAIYNSQIAIDATGRVIASYRKTHLFALPPVREDTCFSPGNEMTSFDLEELRLGLSICYDLRFPELYRTLAVSNGANVFIISSAWPFPRVEHCRVLAMARAIENQSYLVMANRVGTDDRVTFCGTSAIIDPYGVILAAASADREELIHAEISKEVLLSVRGRMEVFAHRRRDLYDNHRS